MTTYDRLTVLRAELRALMMQAHHRGDERRVDDMPPHYWHGVQYGLEQAIDRLETVLGGDDAD